MDLEALASSLQQYRDGHSALIKWIEETTERQENAQPGQTDSRALAEQLAQQTVSVSGGGRVWKPGRSKMQLYGFVSGIKHYQLVFMF